jgi:hypothetical protein
MNLSKEPVLIQGIIGDPITWVAYCKICHKNVSDPVVEENSLAELILQHSETHAE